MAPELQASMVLILALYSSFSTSGTGVSNTANLNYGANDLTFTTVGVL